MAGKPEKRLKTMLELKQTNPIALAVFFVTLFIGVAASGLTGQFTNNQVPTWLLLSFVPAFFFLFAIHVANQWEKAIVLRFGKFNRVAGPGLFGIVPIIETIPAWVDQRVSVTPSAAQKTLMRDTVPVDVDAVLFWIVWDAQKAALEVENYRVAVDWAAQTALRDIIGKMMLADLLVGRSVIDKELQQVIDERTTPWGITVQSVEIRDIVIPQDLEDAMSRQAQAERERQARVILGESEKQIAASFAEAAQAYANNPTALHLRAMNMVAHRKPDYRVLG